MMKLFLSMQLKVCISENYKLKNIFHTADFFLHFLPLMTQICTNFADFARV
jgi:hypothetical protein